MEAEARAGTGVVVSWDALPLVGPPPAPATKRLGSGIPPAEPEFDAPLESNAPPDSEASADSKASLESKVPTESSLEPGIEVSLESAAPESDAQPEHEMEVALEAMAAVKPEAELGQDPEPVTTGGSPGGPSRRRVRVAVAVAAVVAVLLAGVGAGAILRGPSDPQVIVGYTGETLSTPPTAPTVITEPPSTLPPPNLGRAPLPEPGPAVGLKVANGKPYAPAIEFTSDLPIPDDLVFVLVLGSDARPKEDLLATRADSIHLLALNPRTMQGTIVGFPRDSYVSFPRGGRGKINDALSRGGPLYVVETVRAMTGLPIQYYVLSGFVGLQRLVDEVGGVDVFVDRRMNDRFSGARFEKGWQHFVGGEALAFSRNRHDVANGDFTRSEHQGQLLLAGLGKLRSTVANDGGLLMAIDLLRRTCKVDVPLDQLPRLAALARRLDPARLTNVVLPGRIGTAGGGASVVFLTQDAPRLFADLRDDAVIGTAAALPGADVAPSPTTTSSTSTSTTSTSTTSTLQPTTTSTTALVDALPPPP